MRNIPCDMGDDRRHGGIIIEHHNIANDEVLNGTWELEGNILVSICSALKSQFASGLDSLALRMRWLSLSLQIWVSSGS